MTTLTKAKARANETFIVQASLMIVTYDCQNIFIVQATDVALPRSTLWLNLAWFFVLLKNRVDLVTSTSDGKEPKCCLGQIFISKLGCFGKKA